MSLQTLPKLWAANTSMQTNICKISFVTNATGKENARPFAKGRNTWKRPSHVIRQRWKSCRNPARRLSVRLRKKLNDYYKNQMHGSKTRYVPSKRHRPKKRKPGLSVRN